MSETADRISQAIAVWKKRWIAKKRKELILIIALGAGIAAFIGFNYALSPSSDTLIALLFAIAFFVLFTIREIKLLRKRKEAQVTVRNAGFLLEKKNHSQHEIVRAKHTRGCYVDIQTANGTIEAICDSHTYVCSQIGDPLLVLSVENDSNTYAVAFEVQ